MVTTKRGKPGPAPARGAAASKADASADGRMKEPRTDAEAEGAGTKWSGMMMGLWKNMPYFTAPGDVMAPFMQLAKSQQQHTIGLYHRCIDFQLKLHETGCSGDVREVTETCMELSGEFFRAWQESVKEQTLAFYKFWRNYFPTLPGSPEKP